MAFLANPSYGSIPGAPQGLNWWEGPQFFMSGLPQPLPAAAAPPAAPLAATPTPQDVAAYRGAAALTDTGGGQPGGGGPGSGPGGLGGASGGGQDRTTSGYQGVYAQSPVDIDSRFGQAGSTIGMGIGSLAGIPGPGTALGALGGALDASRYNGTLAQNGLPGTVNPWTSALAAAMPGIPFTDLNLGRLFGLQSARQQMDAIINGLAPGLYESGFGALQANQPVGTATRESGPMASYPAGFLDWSGDIARSNAVVSPTEDPTKAMPGTSFYGGMFGLDPNAGKGTFDAGGWADAQGGKGGEGASSTGSAGDKGDVGAGQEGGSGGSSRDGGGDGYKYQGGLIGRPPRGYAVGGPVPQPGDNIGPAAFASLRAVNPPGPDDQLGALQTGEGVLTRGAIGRYPGLLEAANAGTLDPKRVQGMLGRMPATAARARLR